MIDAEFAPQYNFLVYPVVYHLSCASASAELSVAMGSRQSKGLIVSGGYTHEVRGLLQEFITKKLTPPQLDDILQPVTTDLPCPRLSKFGTYIRCQDLGEPVFGYCVGGVMMKESEMIVFPAGICVRYTNGGFRTVQKSVGYLPQFYDWSVPYWPDSVRHALFGAMIEECQESMLVSLRSAIVDDDQHEINEAFRRFWLSALQRVSKENIPGIVEFARNVLSPDTTRGKFGPLLQ